MHEKMNSKPEMKSHVPSQTYGTPLIWSIDGTNHLLEKKEYDLMGAVEVMQPAETA